MKILLLVLVAASAAFGQSSSPIPGLDVKQPKHNVTFSAITVPNEGAAKDGATLENFKTNDGIPDRDHLRSVRIGIEIGTLDREAFAARIRWYIVGKAIDAPDRSLLRSGTHALTVDPKQTRRLILDSGSIAASGERIVAGSKLDGWVLRVVDEQGNELATATSQPAALAWLKQRAEWISDPPAAEEKQ